MFRLAWQAYAKDQSDTDGPGWNGADIVVNRQNMCAAAATLEETPLKCVAAYAFAC